MAATFIENVADHIAVLTALGGAVCLFFVLKYTSPRAADAPLFKVNHDPSVMDGYKSVSSILTYTYPKVRALHFSNN
jgi:hypothetical protein